MRTSDRGSAVAEFVFLILPLIGLASSTASVAWFSFARAQLVQVGNEAAMQLAEADSTSDEVKQACAEKIRARLGLTNFSYEFDSSNDVATVTLESPQFDLPAPITLILPPLSVVSHAPMEF